MPRATFQSLPRRKGHPERRARRGCAAPPSRLTWQVQKVRDLRAGGGRVFPASSCSFPPFLFRAEDRQAPPSREALAPEGAPETRADPLWHLPRPPGAKQRAGPATPRASAEASHVSSPQPRPALLTARLRPPAPLPRKRRGEAPATGSPSFHPPVSMRIPSTPCKAGCAAKAFGK